MDGRTNGQTKRIIEHNYLKVFQTQKVQHEILLLCVQVRSENVRSEVNLINKLTIQLKSAKAHQPK